MYEITSIGLDILSTDGLKFINPLLYPYRYSPTIEVFLTLF